MNMEIENNSSKPCLRTKNGKIVESNIAFTDLTGYSEDEMIGRDMDEVSDILFKAVSYKGCQENSCEIKECFLFTKSYDVREITLYSYQTEEKYEGLYIFVEKPDSRLEDNFPVIEQLYLSNGIGVAFYSANAGILLKANELFYSFLDEPYNERKYSAGKSMYEIVKNSTDSHIEGILKNIIRTGKPFIDKEYMFRGFARGATYWDMTIVPIYTGGILKYVIQMCSEVTQAVLNRKRIEEKAELIKQQKEQLEDIIENMSDALLILDKHGEYIKINKSARDYYFTDTINLVGEGNRQAKFYYLNGNEAAFEDIATKRVLSGERIENYQLIMSLPEKDIRISVNGMPIFDDKGDFYMGIICSRDITEISKYERMKRLEQEVLLEVEKEKKVELEKILTIKDEFLSVISHEFKTPLTVINSAIQTIEVIYKNETPEKVKALIKKIKQNSFRQLRLVNNLLDITRTNAGRININKENHDIVFHTKAIVESVYLYSQQKGIKLNFVSTFDKKVIGIDEEKYERILLNLISNAIKFTPIGKRIMVMLSSKKGFVNIKVKDEGIGIPKDKQDLIFERFGQVDTSLTRQAEGTGIGLSLVKMLVEALGGTISVKTKEGKGSTFSVLLPSTKVQERSGTNNNLKGLPDNRLIHTTAVEFSDIYL